jgi:hypothetical protein
MTPWRDEFVLAAERIEVSLWRWRIMRASGYFIVAVLVAGAWVGVAAGRFAGHNYLPVDRLIENAAAYIREHPQDASGYYTLARIHYLAFVNKAFVAATLIDAVPPTMASYWSDDGYLSQARRTEATRLTLEEFGYASTEDVPQDKAASFWSRVTANQRKLEAENWWPPQPTEEQLVDHAGAAQWNFIKAMSLDPNNALYYLGQASLGEQYWEYLHEKCPGAVPTAIKRILLDGVKQTYFTAYQLAITGDLSRTSLPISGLHGMIGYEAGSAYVRLWEAEGPIPTDMQERIDIVKANLKTLEALPRGAITPIVFGLKGGTSLGDLLLPERTVKFDLDGDGIVELRSWIKPTTGLLAWDTDRDGRITSGRELFGSVTGWLFFSNGYRAMDVLDDNRDGFLTAGELKGISVWFDRDSDGQSDAGEVVSVESLGIAAVATRPTGRDGRSPMHNAGIRFKNGRTVPTYDWIAPPAERLQKRLAQ